ncbi:hypothetical protein [Streptomyces sp. Y1]|uniref:Uncharacterized protein n=1 Tax=Streptomyces sp. Y1 TaxID=3238634 RepID=A0AB39TSX2_9ACTN
MSELRQEHAAAVHHQPVEVLPLRHDREKESILLNHEHLPHYLNGIHIRLAVSDRGQGGDQAA